jgi:hypothetical protein
MYSLSATVVVQDAPGFISDISDMRETPSSSISRESPSGCPETLVCPAFSGVGILDSEAHSPKEDVWHVVDIRRSLPEGA